MAHHLIARFAALALLLPTLYGASPAYADPPVVFAAASLKNALDDAAALYQQETGNTVVLNYAGSATLARQIEQAAPADLFISANIDWMDYLEARDLIDPASRATLFGNAIVLVAPTASDATIDIEAGMPLAALLGPDGRLAMANVDSVPAGLYGKAALEYLGIWDTLADRIVQAENVRSALAFVAREEAPLGVVYATDAVAEPGVRIVGTFPPESHPPILYPAALTTSATASDAAAFLDFLKSGAARPAFERQGFVVLTNGAAAGPGG